MKPKLKLNKKMFMPTVTLWHSLCTLEIFECRPLPFAVRSCLTDEPGSASSDMNATYLYTVAVPKTDPHACALFLYVRRNDLILKNKDHHTHHIPCIRLSLQ